MVFLVQDFVNLPADQIGNIWIAAHMKKNLKKKDIKKTKLGEACTQLHSDNTKKPMQLRHYGQCLIGISWIHLKQVEYLHTDCNEAFSKARLVLVKKRNVELDPSKERVRDITLPEQRGDGNDDLLDLDLNASNFSQLDMEMDNMSDIGSLLGTVSNAGGGEDSRIGDHLAMDHEITLHQNEFSTVSPDRMRDRRSSFGGISSVLMDDLGDMDIEIKFDDDEDGGFALDESQAPRSATNDTLPDITDDDNASVERGRGADDTTLLHQNLSEIGSLHQQRQGHDLQVSLLDDNHSQMSLEKEKERHFDDMSAHSGSVAMGAIPEEMQIDDVALDDDQQSLHVQFDLDSQSVAASVATTALAAPTEQLTPPSSPKNARTAPNANTASKGAKKKKQSKKKRKNRKKRFARDPVIELSVEELRATDEASADFVHRGGRDAIHIWREFPLASLSFSDLLCQPLSRLHFRKWPEDVLKHFALCNAEKTGRSNAGGGDDELADANVLRAAEDVEQGRDDGMAPAMEHNLSLPMGDLSMSSALNLDESLQDHFHQALHEKDRPLGPVLDDDNASTLDSVIDDLIPPPADPLYNEQLDALEMGSVAPSDVDDDIDVDHEPFSLNTEDQDILTQAPQGGAVYAANDGTAMKPRDWSRRAKKTFLYFKNKEGNEFSFDGLMKPETKRNTVVGIFYELLVFKNSDLVDLQQEEPFGDITITKTENFYRHARLSQKLSQHIDQQ